MESKEIDFLKWQFDYNLKQISSADNKMQFITIVYLGLATIIFKKEPFFISRLTNLCLLQCILVILKILFLLLLFYFLYLYWKAITPRTDTSLGNAYKSLIFWKHVSEMNLENFKDISFDKRYEDLFNQIIITAKIANQKFCYVSTAYRMLLLYFVIFLLVLLLESTI